MSFIKEMMEIKSYNDINDRDSIDFYKDHWRKLDQSKKDIYVNMERSKLSELENDSQVSFYFQEILIYFKNYNVGIYKLFS